MENKTAVEWLIERLQKLTWYDEDRLPNVPLNLFEVEQAFDQALEMEKQQIMDAYQWGRTDQNSDDKKWYNRNARIYYSETFKKETE